MITDGTQSVDTDATTIVRGGWTRVGQSISLVIHTEEGVGHFAILGDDDLVCVKVESSG